MKKSIVILLFLFPLFLSAQNSTIYAEFYNQATEKTYTTDLYHVDFYDNVMGLENPTDTIETASSGFLVKMMFPYDSNQDSLYVMLTNSYNGIRAGYKGIVRLKMYDIKLYGYVYIVEVTEVPGLVNVVLAGIPNVPQRKKLLFKDSPRLRMWNHPWINK